MEKEYNEISCFNLTCACIADCFAPVNKKETIKAEKEEYLARKEFADSPLIEMFSDCSHNFVAHKLRDKIKDYSNTELNKYL